MLTFLIVFFVALQNLDIVWRWVTYAWNICLPVIGGFSIAFVLNVPLSFLEDTLFAPLRKSKKKAIRALARPLALILTLIIAIGLIALVALVVIPRLRDTVQLLAENLQGYADSLVAWVSGTLARFNVPQEYIKDLSMDVSDVTNALMKYLKSESSFLAGVAVNAASSVMDVVINAVLGLCIAVYTLMAKEKIGRMMNRIGEAFLKTKTLAFARELASLSFGAFSRFIRGQFLEAIILGVLCFVGMLIFRFPHAAVVSLLIGATALIPIAGAWIGGGVGAFLILLVDPWKALWFLVFILVLQQLEGNLIYPRVVGTSIGLPGLIVLASVIISANIGGIVGMLIGVPITAVLFELLKKAVSTVRAGKKQIPSSPADGKAT